MTFSFILPQLAFILVRIALDMKYRAYPGNPGHNADILPVWDISLSNLRQPCICKDRHVFAKPVENPCVYNTSPAQTSFPQ